MRVLIVDTDSDLGNLLLEAVQKLELTNIDLRYIATGYDVPNEALPGVAVILYTGYGRSSLRSFLTDISSVISSEAVVMAANGCCELPAVNEITYYSSISGAQITNFALLDFLVALNANPEMLREAKSFGSAEVQASLWGEAGRLKPQ